MFFEEMRHSNLLPMMAAIVVAITACAAPKGSIVILEETDGSGFTMEFSQWSSKDSCKLSLKDGDVLKIEVDRQDGKIGLEVTGRNGSEPYTGSAVETGVFTVTVSDTDEYDIQITGKNASGKAAVHITGRE